MLVAENPSHASAHLQDAEEYLEVAEASYDAGHYKASASNACISAIRSSDAVCVAELGERWIGRHHSGAAHVIARTSMGQRGGEFVTRAAESKNAPQYRTVETTPEGASELLSLAREFHMFAKEAIARARLP